MNLKKNSEGIETQWSGYENLVYEECKEIDGISGSIYSFT